MKLFDLGGTIDEIDSYLDSTSYLDSSSWVSIYEPLPHLASSPIPPFVVSLHKLELKTFPSLNYVFLGPKETLPIIISSLLSCDQEEEVIYVLSDRKGAIV